MPTINVTLDTLSRISDIGSVEWYKSTDGENFVKTDGQNTGIRPELKESGKVWYKVKLTNRHSNLSNEIGPVELQAFGGAEGFGRGRYGDICWAAGHVDCVC